jgi:DNA-binding NarL/FixJ family response regulator
VSGDKADDEEPAGELPTPEGLVAQRLDEDLVLLSFPLPEAEVPDALSLAEQEVAQMVFDGASNQEIARARGVSVKTVGNQLESIYRKLGVSSRVELALRLRGRSARAGE